MTTCANTSFSQIPKSRQKPSGTPRVSPAQAMAYRLGYEKMWELRHRAEEALGDAFDIRDYLEVVLSDGAKPLVVLEAKVDRYIASALQD